MGRRLESLLVAPQSSAFSVRVDGIGEDDPRRRGGSLGDTLVLILPRMTVVSWLASLCWATVERRRWVCGQREMTMAWSIPRVHRYSDRAVTVQVALPSCLRNWSRERVRIPCRRVRIPGMLTP
jgi:hypothetical protein